MSERQLKFMDRLSAICALELSDAHGDADRIGEMIERLTNSLAFTIAIAGNGDPKQVETLLRGAESYLYQAATSHAKIAQFMGRPIPRV